MGGGEGTDIAWSAHFRDRFLGPGRRMVAAYECMR